MRHCRFYTIARGRSVMSFNNLYALFSLRVGLWRICFPLSLATKIHSQKEKTLTVCPPTLHPLKYIITPIMHNFPTNFNSHFHDICSSFPSASWDGVTFNKLSANTAVCTLWPDTLVYDWLNDWFHRDANTSKYVLYLEVKESTSLNVHITTSCSHHYNSSLWIFCQREPEINGKK